MNMPVPKPPSTAKRDLTIVVIVAAILRVSYLVITQRVIDMADAIHYINMARQFVSGDGVNFDENLPVLYSLLGAGFYFITNDWEHAFRVTSLIASSLLPIPIYFIARELHGVKSARISILLIACWPWLIDYSSRIAPEALAVTLWFTAIWLLYRGIQGDKRALIIAPIVFFALHLTRPEGTFLMLGSPIAAVTLCYKQRRAHWYRLGIYATSVAVLTGLYALAMRALIGTTTFSYRAPVSDDLIEYFRRGMVPLGETFLRLNFDVFPVMLGPLLLIFFGSGFFRYSDADRRPRLEAFILFFCAIQWAMTVVNLTPSPRYIMTAVIACSLWSAKGIEILHHRASYWKSHRWVRILPLGLVLLTFGLRLAEPIAAQLFGTMPRTPIEYKTAGQWMKDNLEPGYILCRKPQVGFYADMASIGPDATHTPETLAEYAKEIRARYVVYDARHSVNLLPAMAPLLDEDFEHAHFRRVYESSSDHPETRVVVYEVTIPDIDYMSADEFPRMSSHWRLGQKRRTNSAPSP